MTCSMVGLASQLVAHGLDRDPGRLLEREAADARAERREGDARRPDLARPGHRAPDGGLDDGPARPAVAIERDGVDDGPGGERAGRRHDGAAERHRRLADGRELDRVAAGALDRAADPGRHPQRQVGRVHDGVDLQVADVAVPELDARQTYPLRSVSVRRPTGPAAAWYTRGSRRDIDVTISHEFVVRSCARSETRDPLVARRPEQHEFVIQVDRRPGHVGHVGHDRVHRDVADERHPKAADDGAGPIRMGPCPAVAVAERAASRSGSAGPSGTSARS